MQTLARAFLVVSCLVILARLYQFTVAAPKSRDEEPVSWGLFAGLVATVLPYCVLSFTVMLSSNEPWLILVSSVTTGLFLLVYCWVTNEATYRKLL